MRRLVVPVVSSQPAFRNRAMAASAYRAAGEFVALLIGGLAVAVVVVALYIIAPKDVQDAVLTSFIAFDYASGGGADPPAP
jgi:hypothetical protein